MSVTDAGRRGVADFHLGAAVFSSDGKHLGALHRVIVNRDTWEPSQIIVKETRRFSGHFFAPGAGLITDDIIVPLAALAHVQHDRVELSLTSEEVRRLPPYLSYHYESMSGSEALVAALSGLGATGMREPLVETAAKSDGDIEIRQGESVMLGHQGQLLGHVHDVVFDDGELVGIVLRPHGILQHDVILQVRFLERADDLSLFAQLGREDLEKLQPFHPAD